MQVLTFTRYFMTHNNVIHKSLLAVVGMFAFGFLLVPMYDALCRVTGLNGKTARAVETEILETTTVDQDRLITVEFIANKNGNLPWNFTTLKNKMQVHPGKVYDADFSVTNLTDRNMIGQAVPSLSPGLAAKYFNKTECFCFSKQALAARETRNMPLRFIIDPRIPKQVETVTLAYTFFEIVQ